MVLPPDSIAVSVGGAASPKLVKNVARDGLSLRVHAPDVYPHVSVNDQAK